MGGTLHAQISLTATAGTLVGAYPSLTAAFAAVNAGTHQGLITINITSSYVEPGTALLHGSGAGAASYIGILIQPVIDGVVVTGASAIGRGLMELNGADNIVINGDNPNSIGTNRNLTFTNTAANGTAFTSVIRVALSTLVTSSDNVTVTNCILNGSATGRNVLGFNSTTGAEFTSFGILVAGGASTVSNTADPSAITSVSTAVGTGVTCLTFTATNNQIDACARAISVQGSATTVATGTSITNNVIGAATAGNATTVYARGIQVSGFGSATVAGNTIRNLEGFVDSQIAAISICEVAIAGNACLVERNIVDRVYNASVNTFGAYGINIGGGTNHVVRTNCIAYVNHDMTGGSASSTTFGVFGMRLQGSGHQIYHNSVNLFGLRPGTPNGTILSAACGIVNTSASGLDIRNNIFANNVTGGTTAILNAALYLPSGGTAGMNLTLNNNAYYCGSNTSTDGIAQVSVSASAANLYLPGNFIASSNAPATNLRAYTSTLNVAGTNDNESWGSNTAPPFVSNTDLHLNLSSGQLSNVEQKGVSGLVGVATDIDAQVRPNAGTTTPDMGYDEVAVATCAAANAGTISPAVIDRCPNDVTVMTSVGATTGTGISYQWKSSTISGGPYTNVVGAVGATTTSLTVSALLPGTYYYILEVTCAAGPLTGLSNQVTVVVHPRPVVTVTPLTALHCIPTTTPVTLTANGALTYNWLPATGLSAVTGASVSATPAVSTTYSVVGYDANGCWEVATAAITVSTAVVAAATATPSSICLGGNAALLGTGTLPPITYCEPISDCSFPDIISNVTFGTINRSSTCDDVSGYSNYAIPNPTLVAGTSYPLSVTTGGDLEGAAVWIDFDHDGRFDATEMVLNGFLGTLPATYTNPAVLIPLTAYNGVTRMRVRCAYNTNPATLANPACVDSLFGETEDYAITISGGVNPLTYLWTPATFLNASNVPSVTANAVTATTTYLFAATTPGGCTDTATVVVQVASFATAVPSASLPLCVGVGNVLAANATGGSPITYLWSSGGATTPTIVGNNTVGAHSYTVSVTDACGNTGTGSLTYVINSNPLIGVTPSTAAICNGSSPISLTAAGTPTFDWAPAAGLSGVTGANVIANPAGSTNYTVIGTDGNGCKDTVVAFVGVGPAASISAIATPQGLCAGDNTTLTLSGGLPTAAYCIPTYASGTAFGDYIGLVQLGTINNATAGAVAPYHTLFPATGATTTTLVAGDTYTVTLSAGTFTNNDLAAFIDFDQNGILNDLGEKLGETDNLGASPITTSFTFTVPSFAYNGVTRFRVREMDHSGTNDIDACSTQSAFGEVEDYDITIVGGLERIAYAWNPSPNLTVLNNDTVTATNIMGPTTFIATATSGIGCQDTAAVTVLLSSAPPVAVCSSATIVLPLDANGVASLLTAAVDAGSSDACGIANLSLNQGSFGCSDLGTQAITLAVINVNGVSDSCVANVDVVDNIAPSITCPSNTTVVANLCAGGAVVTWAAPLALDNCTPIVTSSHVSGDTFVVGTTTVNYTVADGAGQQATCAFTVTVTANTLAASPNALPSTICEGDPTLLSSNAIGGIAPLTFVWSSGAGTTDPVTVSPTSNTTYTVTVTDACGATAMGSMAVTVVPDPVASFSFVDNHNGTLTFTNTTTNGSTYTWDFGNGQTGTQGAASFTIAYPVAGTYTVVLIASNNCGSDTTTQQVSVLTAVTSSLGDLNSSVYPNPNRGEFFLVLENMRGEHLEISISDIRGIEVQHLDLDIDASHQRESIDISHYAKGLYFLHLRTQSGVKVHKITVQ